MKKKIAVIVVFSLFLLTGTTVYASEAQIDKDGQSVNADVYAEVSDEGWSCSSEVENGEAAVIIDDKMEICVQNIPQGAVRFWAVPIPKTETEAWSWFTSCFDNVGTPMHAFSIYFVDQNDTKLSAAGAVVTISCSHCTAASVGYSLMNDGTICQLKSSGTKEKMITFTADDGTYFTVVESSNGSQTSEKNDLNTGGSVSTSSKTGDDSNLILWSILMFISILGMGVIWNRRRKYDADR